MRRPFNVGMSRSSSGTTDGRTARGVGDQYMYRAVPTDEEESSTRRRNLFQRPIGADGTGVIRSASLQHHPTPLNFMPAGVTTTSSASAIGTNHIHHHHNNHHHLGLNRSSSTGDGPSKPANLARNFKKTVRFDADEDLTAQSTSTSTSPQVLAANGLAQSSDNKTWDWLMKGHNSRQESRDSAARDSGVETLTSGEDVVVSAHHQKHHPYDHRAKVNTRRARPTDWPTNWKTLDELAIDIQIDISADWLYEME